MHAGHSVNGIRTLKHKLTTVWQQSYWCYATTRIVKDVQLVNVTDVDGCPTDVRSLLVVPRYVEFINFIVALRMLLSFCGAAECEEKIITTCCKVYSFQNSSFLFDLLLENNTRYKRTATFIRRTKTEERTRVKNVQINSNAINNSS